MEILELFLHTFINLAILLFEYIGVAIITFSGIQGFLNYIRKNPETRLILAKGLAMGLEFKLGSEILRTVIVNSIQEICIVAGIILLRATLTVLIHWEIKNEQKESAGKSSSPEPETGSAAQPTTAKPEAENAAQPTTAKPEAENATQPEAQELS